MKSLYITLGVLAVGVWGFAAYALSTLKF